MAKYVRDEKCGLGVNNFTRELNHIYIYKTKTKIRQALSYFQ